MRTFKSFNDRQAHVNSRESEREGGLCFVMNYSRTQWPQRQQALTLSARTPIVSHNEHSCCPSAASLSRSLSLYLACPEISSIKLSPCHLANSFAYLSVSLFPLLALLLSLNFNKAETAASAQIKCLLVLPRSLSLALALS